MWRPRPPAARSLPGRGYAACWRNAIVALDSSDGGRSFRRRARPGRRAALSLFRRGTAGAPATSTRATSCARGDHLYAFVFAEAYGAQRRGRVPAAPARRRRRRTTGAPGTARASPCLRRPLPRGRRRSGRHVCAPVARARQHGLERRRGTALGRYLAVTPTTTAAGRRRAERHLLDDSEDLVAGANPRCSGEAPLLWRRDCAAPAAYAYPSLIDPTARRRNFERSTGASGSISSRCRSAPAAGSGRSAT